MNPPKWTRSATLCAAALSLSAGLNGCSGNSANNGTDAGGVVIPEDVHVTCADDSRVVAYMPNLTKSGEAGSFKFVLVSSSRVPPAVGTNVWTIKLLDAGGQPVTDATFPMIKAWMPDHGHGSSAVPAAMNNGDGTYTISPLYLQMPGVWEITFSVKSGAVADTATFTLCVGG